MATINRNITLDVSTYARATEGTENNISKRLGELIEKGLLYETQQKAEPTLNECIEMLIRAYKGTQKEVKVEVKENPIQEIEQNDSNSYWGKKELQDYLDELFNYDEPNLEDMARINKLLLLKKKYNKAEFNNEDEELEVSRKLSKVDREISEIIEGYKILGE